MLIASGSAVRFSCRERPPRLALPARGLGRGRDLSSLTQSWRNRCARLYTLPFDCNSARAGNHPSVITAGSMPRGGSVPRNLHASPTVMEFSPRPSDFNSPAPSHTGTATSDVVEMTWVFPQDALEQCPTVQDDPTRQWKCVPRTPPEPLCGERVHSTARRPLAHPPSPLRPSPPLRPLSPAVQMVWSHPCITNKRGAPNAPPARPVLLHRHMGRGGVAGCDALVRRRTCHHIAPPTIARIPAGTIPFCRRSI